MKIAEATTKELPDGWSRADWEKRRAADETPEGLRTEDQWDLLDRAAVWSEGFAAVEPAPVGEDDGSLYALGAGEIIEP